MSDEKKITGGPKILNFGPTPTRASLDIFERTAAERLEKELKELDLRRELPQFLWKCGFLRCYSLLKNLNHMPEAAELAQMMANMWHAEERSVKGSVTWHKWETAWKRYEQRIV